MADQTTPAEKRATYPEAERSFLSVEWERIAKSQRQTINRLEQERDQLATAPADALREMKAAAWDEGHDAGWEDRHQDALAGWMPSDPYESEAVNPYRDKEQA